MTIKEIAQVENLIVELEKALTKPYLSVRELFDLGIFGSIAAANAALKRKTLPSVKVGPRRVVVPRSAVLDFFRKNLEETNQPLEPL